MIIVARLAEGEALGGHVGDCQRWDGKIKNLLDEAQPSFDQSMEKVEFSSQAASEWEGFPILDTTSLPRRPA